MTTFAVSSALAPVAAAPSKRAARDRGRAEIFNRLSIVVMFATIIAIGSAGIFALVQRQGDETFERTNLQSHDITLMQTALDREYADVLSQLAAPRGAVSDRFARATHMFDAARVAFQRDVSASSEPLLQTLAARHAAFVVENRVIVDAVSSGDRAKAIRVEAQSATPDVTAIRQALDSFSAASFHASLAANAGEKRSSLQLERLIAVITILGPVLMVAFAFQLRRYKRSADSSAAATLTALEQAALTDSLTGLGNNRSFYDDFERELARAKRHGHSLVLALIDVDDFKAVNDKGGHSHGDAVLALIGGRLQSSRKEDRGYRIGGDEFALLLVETGAEAAGLALGRLQAEIRESALGATISIGYVNLAGDQLDAESYELADTALYEAKRLGRNQTVCFEAISGTVSVFSPRKAEVVRRMIEEGLVSTAFQPIWDVQSTQPLGFEALARPLPELGLAGPQEAFDVAQRIRQLPELDRLCTRRSLDAAGNLPSGSVIFLNYSPASLAHASFDPQTFVDTVRAAGLLPGQIVIELTERRIDDPTIVAKRAVALRALGVRIALDDTGSGHAGLEILSKVRFDFVKIDRGLVIDAMRNREARGVLAGIIAIARETKSYLIAEGIETREMLDFIRNVHIPKGTSFAGIRGIQGYLLGRPESGPVDLRSLEEHHAFLETRQREERRMASLLEALSGDESIAARHRSGAISGAV